MTSVCLLDVFVFIDKIKRKHFGSWSISAWNPFAILSIDFTLFSSYLLLRYDWNWMLAAERHDHNSGFVYFLFFSLHTFRPLLDRCFRQQQHHHLNKRTSEKETKPKYIYWFSNRMWSGMRFVAFCVELCIFICTSISHCAYTQFFTRPTTNTNKQTKNKIYVIPNIHIQIKGGIFRCGQCLIIMWPLY